MSRTLIAGLCTTGCLLLAPGAAAQTVPTNPVQSVTQEGLGASFAFQWNRPTRVQTLYESRHVYRPLPQWSTLLLRPDDGPFPRASYPAFTRPLTIRVSSSGVPSPELASRTSFSANHGSDLSEVLTGKPVSFPAFQPTGSGPAPFLVQIPLDRPFVLQPRLGHLLIEIDALAVPGGPPSWSWLPDAAQWTSTGWTVLADTFGTGCPQQQSYSASFSSTTSMLRTTLRFARQPGSATSHPGVAWFGTNTRSLGLLPLPLPLGFLGAPGCSIYTEPAAAMFGRTGGGSGESFSVSLPVPRNFSLVGKELFSQTAVFDPNAGNPAGLRVSKAGRFLFSTPPSPLEALTLIDVGSLDDTPQRAEPDRALVVGVQ